MGNPIKAVYAVMNLIEPSSSSSVSASAPLSLAVVDAVIVAAKN